MDDLTDVKREEFMDKYGLSPEDYIRMYEDNPQEGMGAIVWMCVSIVLLVIGLITLAFMMQF